MPVGSNQFSVISNQFSVFSFQWPAARLLDCRLQKYPADIHASLIVIYLLLCIIQFMSSDTLSSGQLSLAGVSSAALVAFREAVLATRDQAYWQAIQYYGEALQFQQTPDEFRARRFEYRGQCFWLVGEFRAAEKDYNESLTTSDSLEQISRARVRLGELADFQGEYGRAEKLFHQALQEGVEAENLLVIGRARRGLGIVQRRQGNTEKALSHLTQALTAVRQAGEMREQGRVLISLGRTHQARGDYQLALNAYEEARTILENLHDRWRIAQVINYIGECYQSLYAIDLALAQHQEALQITARLDAVILTPEIKRNLGIDLVETGQYEAGLAYLQASLEGARELGSREGEAYALYHLGRVYTTHADYQLASRSIDALHKVADMLDIDRFRALAALARGELLFHQERRAEAMAELNAAMLAAQTAVDRGILWKLHAALSYVSDNAAIAAVHRAIAADFIRQTAEPLQDPRLKTTFLHAPPVLAALQAARIDPASL